jgi:peptidoglycan/xylan/chitin deacetylase (PgdA/CDA1 family)
MRLTYRNLTALVVLLLAGGIGKGWTDSVPSTPLEPGDGSGRFQIYVEASRTEGVVPFEAAFKLKTTGPREFIRSVYWDLGTDGLPDALGDSASFAFDTPGDYDLRVTVNTIGFGTFERTLTISGYSALLSITFDDGPLSVYTQALPLLESKGVKATAYIVPTWISTDEYMNWDQVRRLHEAGWVIGSHSMTHQKLPTLADSSLDYEIRQAQVELQSRGFPARHFAAPHCRYDDDVIEVIRQYHVSNRICDGVNPAPEDTDPYRLLSFLSYSWRSLFTYQVYIDSAISMGGWCIMANHEVAEDCTSDVWCMTTQMLSDVVDYAREQRVKIVTIDEMLVNKEPSQMAGLFPTADAGRAVEVRPALSPVIGPAGTARIEYTVFEPVHLDVSLYDVTGRRVRRLFSGRQVPGDHSHDWNGRDEDGVRVGSGSYFYLLRVGDRTVGKGRIIVAR